MPESKIDAPSPVTLSYFLVTRNKLPYLKVCIEDLIKNRAADEEIVVVDGGSTDGSAEYLESMLKDKKIQQLISEPDCGEGHADNKAVLMARGTLLKLITDDDVFHYPSIARCKAFMLEHPEIDMLSTDGIKCRKAGSQYPMGPLQYRAKFTEWMRRGTPFDSCGLGLMIRRSSLPLLGLFHPGFVRMDAEYTLRTTAGKANIAWYGLECYARILNPASNTTTQSDRYERDTERLEAFYYGKNTAAGTAFLKMLKRLAKRHLKLTRRTDEQIMTVEEWKRIYDDVSEWIVQNAQHNRGEFLWRR